MAFSHKVHDVHEPAHFFSLTRTVAVLSSLSVLWHRWSWRFIFFGSDACSAFIFRPPFAGFYEFILAGYRPPHFHNFVIDHMLFFLSIVRSFFLLT